MLVILREVAGSPLPWWWPWTAGLARQRRKRRPHPRHPARSRRIHPCRGDGLACWRGKAAPRAPPPSPSSCAKSPVPPGSTK